MSRCRKRRSIPFLPLAAALALAWNAAAAYAQTGVFKQLNFDLNGTPTNATDWGTVDLTFTGTSAVQYFNLRVGPDWVIQNIPVQSLEGPGPLQTQRFWFDVGDSGTVYTSISYGMSLTPAIIVSAPSLTSSASVGQDTVRIYSGATGGGANNKPAKAGPQVGGAAAGAGGKAAAGFPNQEAGKNECVPVGISNSLQYLNQKNGLGMAAGDIGIAGLKGGTGWGAGGCPRPGWVDNKKNYVKNKKLPITTRKLAGPGNIANIANELNNGQDVEMDIAWAGGGAHCVCITGITPLGGGKYSVEITHDNAQGKAGGTVSENATYDKNTGKWGGALANGTNDFFFVVECPAQKIQNGNQSIPPGTNHGAKSESKNFYRSGQYAMKNLQISNISNTFPLPPLGNSSNISFNCLVTLDLSSNGDVSYTTVQAPATVTEHIAHTQDSGGVQYFDTEMTQLDIIGGSLPPGIRLRESPTLASTGEMTMLPVGGGGQFTSFFDVFTELSIDNGASYGPESDGATTMIEDSGTPAPMVNPWGLAVVATLLAASAAWSIRNRRGTA